jgi:predicted DNA-binding transcriptional regulator YafY
MRKADRLFQLVQILRRDRCSTAARLAHELEVSERTVYRDIQDLMKSGVPISGEAGVGYGISARFELPPLALGFDEIEALVMGARMVSAWADPWLKAAASSLLAKVEAVLPEGRTDFRRMPLMVPDFHVPKETSAFVGELRRAIRENRKIYLAYTRGDGQASERVVRPLGLAFWGDRWNLVAWCEMRQEFRAFRPDRIRNLRALDEKFEPEAGRRLEDYLERLQAEVDHWVKPATQAPE